MLNRFLTQPTLLTQPMSRIRLGYRWGAALIKQATVGKHYFMDTPVKLEPMPTTDDWLKTHPNAEPPILITL